MIKRWLDSYVPLKVIVRHRKGRTELIIQTKRKTEYINVFEFIPAECWEVLRRRIRGLEFGRYKLGRYKGAHGEVYSYAISCSGILIKDSNGTKYYLAFNNIQEVIDALLDDNIQEKVIEVRR
ncbi:hypothetical protein [Thermococcus guaymasensis]|nr:hypothetical protein [Thermococcus guaymasensis]